MTEIATQREARIARVEVVISPVTSIPKTTRARRARVVIGVAVVAFLLVQFGLSRAIESDVVPVGDPIFSEKFQHLRGHPEFFQAESSRQRLLALGSSRTLLAVDAESLGKQLNRSAMNLGWSGSGPITAALYIRRLIRYGVRAETILIELHPPMLGDCDPPFESRWLHPYRIKADEVNVLHRFGWCIARPVQHEPLGWLHSTQTYRVGALNQFAPTWLACPYGLTLGERCDRFGFVPGVEELPANRDQLLLRECTTYISALQHYQPGGAAVAAVQDLMEQCRSIGATPILWLAPESSEFRSWYGNQGTKALNQWATNFASQHRVRLIDAREWLPDNMFADGHHLTVSGSRACTTRLAQELSR